MNLFEPELQLKIQAAIERDGKQLTKQMLEDLLAAANQYKHDSYDTHHAMVRRHYEGKSHADLDRELRLRYPNTGGRMSKVPFNLVRHVAQIDASVYDIQPRRDLVEDGEILDAPLPKPKTKPKPPGSPDAPAVPDAFAPDEPTPEEEDAEAAEDEADEALAGEEQPVQDEATGLRVKAFQNMLKKSRLHRVMPEAERRVCVSYTQFPVWRWDFHRSAPRLDLFWPNDVWVVPDPWDPVDMDKSIAVIFRVSSGASGRSQHTWYEVWTRPREAPKPDKPPTYGKWQVCYIRSDGQFMLPENSKDGEWPIEGHAPFSVYHQGLAIGSPYLDEDRDLIHVTTSINICVIDTVFTLALQGHTQLVYKGNRKDGNQLILGPGVAARIGPNEELTAVDMNPKLTEMNETSKFLLKFLALTRSQSPDAYNVDSTEKDASGISKRISNGPQEKKRREAVEAAKDLEENQLLGKAVAMYDLWGDQDEPMIMSQDESCETTFQFTASEPPEFETMTEKQTRLMELKADGFMTDAEVAVELGVCKTIDDAIRKGLSNELKKKPPPPLIGGLPGMPPLAQAPGEHPSGFAKRAAGRMGADPAKGTFGK